MLRRLAVALLLSGLAVVATATQATAHARLIGSDPAQGAALAAAPRQVQLTFDEPVTLGATPVTITGPAGAAWTVGAAVADGTVVTAPVLANGPAGQYALVYEVVSKDGDAVTGSVTFTLTTAVAPPTTTTTTTTTTTAPVTTAPATAATTTAATTTKSAPARSDAVAPAADDGAPGWVWVLAGVVVLAVIVVVVLRLARARRS